MLAALRLRSLFVPGIPVAILAAMVILAIFAPALAPYSPIDGNLVERLKPPFWLTGGSSEYLLGTDALGRDCLSRLIHGARISLIVGVLGVLFSGTVGTLIGLVSGYKRGYADIVLMRLTDIGLSLPLILIALVLVTVLGPSFFNIILVLVLLLWPRYARLIRGETLGVGARDHVALARVAGCSGVTIVRKHIFPNILPSLLVMASLQVGYVILLEASLSFLGVGIPPPQPSWGLMAAEGRGLIGVAWWVSVWPGTAVFLTVLSANLLGDWVRDKFDPRLRQV